MKTYLVGGAVRDALMVRDAGASEASHVDRDWVVVGATSEAMVQQGFLPVGRDFPVFLHPETREEYALARTERKTSPGYRGFVVHAEPGVTLEEDLARRDLTINAMAVAASEASDPARGQIIDPHNGRHDLQHRVLRHVTDAFTEDPVRILRLARFAARFPDFSVAPETLALMRNMVEHGEVDHLVAERVWQELARGLMEQRPSRLFEVLRDCGALKRLLPEVDRLWGVPQRAEYHPEIDTGVHLMMVLDMSARLAAPLTVRFACLGHDLGKGTTPPDVLCSRACASGCACRWTAANWPMWWRANTATSTAAKRWALPRWCGCLSAATRCASRRVFTRCCWPANAMRAGGWV